MTDDSGTRYDQKNEEKFTLLFEMYGKAMRRKAYAILRDRDWAEDAVQIAFEKVYRHINNIEDPYSHRTKSYLITIVSHDCYEMLKKNQKYYLMAIAQCRLISERVWLKMTIHQTISIMNLLLKRFIRCRRFMLIC